LETREPTGELKPGRGDEGTPRICASDVCQEREEAKWGGGWVVVVWGWGYSGLLKPSKDLKETW